MTPEAREALAKRMFAALSAHWVETGLFVLDLSWETEPERLRDDWRVIADVAGAAVAEEREACAQVAEATNDCCECIATGCCRLPCPTADAIRARGGQPEATS